MKKFFSIALIATAFSMIACADQGKQFAATTDRVAGYVGTGLIIVDQQTTTGQMSADTGVAIVTALRAINTLNGQLIAEAKNHIDANGNLNLTAEGQSKLLSIVNSSTAVVNTLVNDPRVTSIPNEKRVAINAVIGNLNATLVSLDELIKAIKLAKGGK